MDKEQPQHVCVCVWGETKKGIGLSRCLPLFHTKGAPHPSVQQSTFFFQDAKGNVSLAIKPSGGHRFHHL